MAPAATLSVAAPPRPPTCLGLGGRPGPPRTIGVLASGFPAAFSAPRTNRSHVAMARLLPPPAPWGSSPSRACVVARASWEEEESVTLERELDRTTVVLQRPLGLVLAEGAGGVGAWVEELVPGGSAAKAGGVLVGDALVAAGPEGSKRKTELEGLPFDDVLDALGGDGALVVVLEREVVREVKSEASSFWDRKRAAKARGPTDRTTPGLVAKDVVVETKGEVGKGSFGSVFRGEYGGEAVVLKRANERVGGAEELLELERQLNELAAGDAPDAVARYIGSIEVAKDRDEGQLYNGTLPAGLWLMFAYEGSSTLESYISREGGLAELGAQLAASGGGGKGGKALLGGILGRRGGGSSAKARGRDAAEVTAVKEVMRQVLGCAASLHRAGIVHRDLKPSNVIVCEQSKGGGQRLRLIDLGAAAECLSTPLCYTTGDGPCDPDYCSVDEMWLLPDDAPRPGKSNLGALWEEYKPDRFDAFSAGTLMMQLGVPALRDAGALKRFQSQLSACGSSLPAWREKHGASVGAEDSPALDGPGGWDLAAALLAPRLERLSAEEALRSPYLK